MKYFRYDKELYEAKHPTLRKILEGDDIPEKRMVLCVSDILTVIFPVYYLTHIKDSA